MVCFSGLNSAEGGNRTLQEQRPLKRRNDEDEDEASSPNKKLVMSPIDDVTPSLDSLALYLLWSSILTPRLTSRSLPVSVITDLRCRKYWHPSSIGLHCKYMDII